MKWFLAISHYLALLFLGTAAAIAVVGAWSAVLITGRYPRALFDFAEGVMRWALRVDAYAFLLVTDRTLARWPLPAPRSLDTLLDFVGDERTKQIERFDALDNKAGIVLGFAGLLITLAPDVPTLLLVPALIAAASAADFSFAAFWPRPHTSLQPTPMRKYLAADDRFTRQRLFDTLEVLINTISDDLATQARRLTWALGHRILLSHSLT